MGACGLAQMVAQCLPQAPLCRRMLPVVLSWWGEAGLWQHRGWTQLVPAVQTVWGALGAWP